MTLELLTRETDVSADVKRVLLDQDAQMWRNTRWQAESRRRVYQRIGNRDAEVEQIKILQQCESALMELEEQSKEL